MVRARGLDYQHIAVTHENNIYKIQNSILTGPRSILCITCSATTRHSRKTKHFILKYLSWMLLNDIRQLNKLLMIFSERLILFRKEILHFIPCLCLAFYFCTNDISVKFYCPYFAQIEFSFDAFDNKQYQTKNTCFSFSWQFCRKHLIFTIIIRAICAYNNSIYMDIVHERMLHIYVPDNNAIVCN